MLFLRLSIGALCANNQLLSGAYGSGLAGGKDVKERRHKPHSACKEGLKGRGGSLSSASVLADVSAQMCKKLPFFFFLKLLEG